MIPNRIRDDTLYEVFYFSTPFSEMPNLWGFLQGLDGVLAPFFNSESKLIQEYALFDQYLYIESSKSDFIFRLLQTKIKSTISRIGFLTGEEIVDFFTRHSAGFSDSFIEGEYYKITSGEYVNLIVKLISIGSISSKVKFECYGFELELEVANSFLQHLPEHRNLEPSDYLTNLLEDSIIQGQSRLMIVDGHDCLWRSFYNFRNLRTKSGVKIGAGFGFYYSLLSLLELYPDFMLVVVFDSSGSGWMRRGCGYPGFFELSELERQIFKNNYKWVCEFLASVGIPICRFSGTRSEDLIGTLIMRARERKFSDIYLNTSDVIYHQFLRYPEFKVWVPKLSFKGYSRLIDINSYLSEIPITDLKKHNWYLSFVGDSLGRAFDVNRCLGNRGINSILCGDDYIPLINRSSSLSDLHYFCGKDSYLRLFFKSGDFQNNLNKLFIDINLDVDLDFCFENSRPKVDVNKLRRLLIRFSMCKEVEVMSKLERIFKHEW